MSYFMLILVLGIFTAFIYEGNRRGLVRTVFSLFSSIVVLLVGTVISPVISNQLRNNEKIFNYISDKIEKSLENYQKNDEEAGEEKEKSETKITVGTEEVYVPTALIGGEKVVDKLISDILTNEKLVKAKEDLQKEVNRRVAVHLTGIVINSGTFVAVYLILSTGLFVLGRLLNIVSKLPVLNEINRLGGSIAGFFKGLIVVWIIFTVMLVFIDRPLVQEGMRQINENGFLSLLYKYNVVAKVIGLK